MAYFRSKKAGQTGTDKATRAYASRVGRKYGVASPELRDVTTFIDPVSGQRKAKGSFQIVGLTAASLGFGTGMLGGEVTGDTGLSAFEFAAKYHHVGVGPSGEKLYSPRITPTVPKAPAARGMIGEQTTLHPGLPIQGYSKPSMGGMGKGEWQRPQKPKEVTAGGAGVGTVIAVGGIGYLIWRFLK